MIYAYVIAIVAVFGAGYATSNKLNEAEIQKLHNAIERSNADADMVLRIATEKVRTANAERAKLNQELETANAQSINTINHLHDDIVRLHGDNKQNGRSTLPKGSSSALVNSEALSAALSTGLSGFLEWQLYDADKTASYAVTAWQFINENCGIK